MPFETFNTPEIVPDNEQAQVWAKVKDHFESVLEGEEESQYRDEEAAIMVREALDAIEENDWSKAYEYLEREIDQLEKRYEMVKENETAKKIGTPEFIREEIVALESLKDSLILEEKE